MVLKKGLVMHPSFPGVLFTQFCVVYKKNLKKKKREKICLEPHQEHKEFSLDEEDTVNSSDQIKVHLMSLQSEHYSKQ